MQRRAFVPFAAGLALVPARTFAQSRVPVVGVLDPGDAAEFLGALRMTLAAKRLQIMRDVVTSLRRLAVFVNINEPYTEILASTFEQAGKPFGLQTISLPTSADSLGGSLVRLEGERPDAIYIPSSLPA